MVVRIHPYFKKTSRSSCKKQYGVLEQYSVKWRSVSSYIQSYVVVKVMQLLSLNAARVLDANVLIPMYKLVKIMARL